MIDYNRKTVESTDEYNIQPQNLKNLLNTVNKFIETYGEDAKVEFYQNVYDDYENYLLIIYDRLETDEEMKRRIDYEEKSEYYNQKRENFFAKVSNQSKQVDSIVGVIEE